jgi:glutathione peroxidase
MDRPKPIKKTRESRLQAAMSKKKKSKRAMHGVMLEDSEDLDLAPKAAGAGAGLHSFTMKDIDGKPVKLAAFKGKVLLVVNVASLCGNTPQYAGLQSLYDRYRDQGFEILAFPSNDFGKEEPGSDAEIKQFCSSKYQVAFPLFSKIEVTGKGIHPLYRHLCDEGEFPGPVTWNFEKFLVGRDGEVLERFSPDTQPQDEELVQALEEALES